MNKNLCRHFKYHASAFQGTTCMYTYHYINLLECNFLEQWIWKSFLLFGRDPICHDFRYEMRRVFYLTYRIDIYFLQYSFKGLILVKCRKLNLYWGFDFFWNLHLWQQHSIFDNWNYFFDFYKFLHNDSEHRFSILQFIDTSSFEIPSSLKLQTYLDNSVEFLYLSCLNDVPWLLCLCLKLGSDNP